jgi:hypothetical protein
LKTPEVRLQDQELMRVEFKEIREQLQHILQDVNKELPQESRILLMFQLLTHIIQKSALLKNLQQSGVSDLK